LYVTFDLITALVVSGAFVAGVLVYRRTAPPEGATGQSRGERLAVALGAAATVIVIGSYLGGGFRGIEHAANPAKSEVSR
jgi:hypothetical protein